MIGLEKLIDWEGFREILPRCWEKLRKNAAGRKAFDVVLMFKALVLQHLSD
ncbi:transposase [Nitrosococcus wardiae]|uniref:transposase n=1 Tax=Nitrosococcus wardiae TaxID=1814290 RepID=UPI00141A6B75|nr:transposase [Nitrosococcus wardiae]